MSLLTDADEKLLPAAMRQNGGFHLAAQWYLRGWSPLWYQYYFHQALQPNFSFLAGIATGKTTSVAASYMIDCLTTPYFRALNTSVTAKQAELPFEMVMGWIEGNDRLEHLIEDVSLRPYPTIKFKNYAEWVFRTAGKDGRFIRGMEFDRINYDEAGLDFSGDAPKVLRGRLRGVRPDGTRRMTRLDVTTSPTAAPWLKERFFRGWKGHQDANLEDYFSLRISTYENTHLTKKTIELMEAEYSDDMIDVELRAMFPDYGLSMFPSTHLDVCADQSLNDAVEMGLRPEKGKPRPGYRLEEHTRYGITLFEMPVDPYGHYVMAGDPGQDGPPQQKRGGGDGDGYREDAQPDRLFPLGGRARELQPVPVFLQVRDGEVSANLQGHGHHRHAEGYRRAGVREYGLADRRDQLPARQGSHAQFPIEFRHQSPDLLAGDQGAGHANVHLFERSRQEDRSGYRHVHGGAGFPGKTRARRRYTRRPLDGREYLQPCASHYARKAALMSDVGKIFVWNVLTRIVHHNDCTWCKHRQVFKKAIEGKYELELCGLTQKKIPAPPAIRLCEHYQQIDCSCESCNTDISIRPGG